MALVFLGAAYQDTDKNNAAKFLRKAVETTNDVPTIALQGLLNCCDPAEVPDICEKLLKLTPEKYEDLYKRILDGAAAGIETAENCARALQDDVDLPVTDENLKRIGSAYAALGQIYLKFADSFISDEWLPLVS